MLSNRCLLGCIQEQEGVLWCGNDEVVRAEIVLKDLACREAPEPAFADGALVDAALVGIASSAARSPGSRLAFGDPESLGGWRGRSPTAPTPIAADGAARAPGNAQGSRCCCCCCAPEGPNPGGGPKPAGAAEAFGGASHAARASEPAGVVAAGAGAEACGAADGAGPAKTKISAQNFPTVRVAGSIPLLPIDAPPRVSSKQDDDTDHSSTNLMYLES